MAVSNFHGGGLTLQRVAADSLFRFDALISVGGFGRLFAAAEKANFLSQQIDLPLDRLPSRLRLLRRLKPWLRRRASILNMEAQIAWGHLTRIIGHRTPRLLVCPQGYISVRLTSRAVEELGAQYITWVMDDHPLKFGGASMRYRADYEAQWRDHLQKAHKIYVISDAMREFYRDMFGVDSDVLHGALPLRADTSAAASPRRANQGVRLGYAGSLSGWQQDPLELLADVARGVGAELHVAGHELPRWLLKPAAVYRGQLAPEQAREMLAECDAVILPVSFSPEYTAMSRLNVATKLSELCACGRPILAIGPADAAMTRILLEHGAAVCVTSLSRKDLAMGVTSVLDKNVSRRVTANARRLFEKELNLENMQRRWQEAADWLFGSSLP